MTQQPRALFLSLRPVYAEMLLSGDKTVELRRVRPKADIGMPIILYSSSPARAIVGLAEVGGIEHGTPDETWALHGPRTGLHHREFCRYFHGADVAVAITVTNARSLRAPMKLTDLRRHWVGFQPPQSFRYIEEAAVDCLGLDLELAPITMAVA